MSNTDHDSRNYQNSSPPKEPRQEKDKSPKSAKTMEQEQPNIIPENSNTKARISSHSGPAVFKQANNQGNDQAMADRQVVDVQEVPSKSSRFPRYNRRNDNDEDWLGQPPGYAGFSDLEVRRLFVRKVYFILMLQLLFTFLVISLFVFEPHVNEFVTKNFVVYIIAVVLFFASFIGLVCSGELRRKFPANMIILAIFTAAASYMLGIISSYYSTPSLLMAVGITAVVCFVVTIFSFNTRFDFTSCGGILCILLVVLLVFGIAAIISESKVMAMIYAGLGAIVFTMYLAYDTQMIMGGKNVEIHPEEYIFATICLYMDVMYIFLFILTLFDR